MSKLIQISTAEELQDIALETCYRDEKDNIIGNFILTNDIDLSSIDNFEPIGAYPISFTGIFNGNGYIVRNLNVNKPNESHVGLFGYIGKKAQIKNVQLLDADITGDVYVGGLVGYMGGGTVKGHSSGDITGNICVGGLVGRMSGGIVAGHSTGGRVKGSGLYIGGLVGYMADGTVTGCNEAYVKGGYGTGGLVGKMWGGIVKGRNDEIVNGYGKYTSQLVGKIINGDVINTNLEKEENQEIRASNE